MSSGLRPVCSLAIIALLGACTTTVGESPFGEPGGGTDSGTTSPDGDAGPELVPTGAHPGETGTGGDGGDGSTTGGGSSSGGGGDSGATSGTGADTSAAPAACGDGVAEDPEECDGPDLAGATCLTQGFDEGTLACTASCTFDTSDCVRYVCGNGVLEGNEECDSTELDGRDCQSEGFDGGLLLCDAGCDIDTTLCNRCGNGVVDADELCEGADLGGVTCEDLGFEAGTLACNVVSCGFDTSGCGEPLACDNSPLPPGGTCPPQCTGGCDLATNTCIVDCESTGGCRDITIACPQHWNCNVLCNGTAPCRYARIFCPDNYACDISCIGTSPCDDALFDCGDGPCNVYCQGTGPCGGSTLACSRRQSRIACGQINTVDPEPVILDPQSACLCEVDTSCDD